MKKILLLSITSLAMLMADFTLEGSKLTPVSETTSTVTEPTPPPTTTDPANTSGIIPNSTNLIWADMHDAPTGWPVATSSGYSQFIGPTFYGQLTAKTDNWGAINAWFEVEEGTFGKDSSCGSTANTATNTLVELTQMYLMWLDYNNNWHVTLNGDGALGGSSYPKESMLFTGNRGCNVSSIENIRSTYLGYNVWKGQSGSHYLFEPKYYYRVHGWAMKRATIDIWNVKAVYVAQWARLILKDPNGPDDRYKANQVIHVSSDRKMADGTQIPGQEGWGIGGISRYKKIPSNGEWMPINFIEGDITKVELDTNPPPFPKAP